MRRSIFAGALLLGAALLFAPMDTAQAKEVPPDGNIPLTSEYFPDEWLFKSSEGIEKNALHLTFLLMVAAAGNNAGKGILYPAAYPEVIAVGATTSDGTVLSGAAAGNELELFAPGSQIISTGMVDGYTTGSGTSLATAEVTGIASLLLAQPGATADMVRGLLRATAKEIAGSNAGLVDYGYAQEHFSEYLAAYQNGEVDEKVFENPAVPETYDTDGMVNGLWDKDAHAWLIGKANESLSLNTTYVTIMSYTAKRADNSAYHDSNTVPQYNGLHGFGAYSPNLYAIWKFANYTKRGETAAQAKTLSLRDLSDAIHGKTISAQYLPDGLLDACVELVSKDSTVISLGYANTDAKKKYLVVGFACHMIGDTYAHRTLVPAYAVDKATESGHASNNSSDWGSRLGKKYFDDWTGLLTAYSNKELTFTNLKTYAKKSITNFNTYYEDNTEFCRERLNAALNCTRNFLREISSANNTASATMIQQQTNVELIKYSEYLAYFY